MTPRSDQESSKPTADQVEAALRSFQLGSPAEFDRLVDEGEEPASGICSLFAEIVGLSLEEPPVPQAIGDYTIIREIGRGGMAVVFEAKQERIGRSVALKVIRRIGTAEDSQVKLFRREVDTLARLKHPHIATLYDAGQTQDGHHYFAMELVGGVNLAEYSASGKINGDVKSAGGRDRLELFCKICRAMNYAHQRGVIHRDLKPSNIFVDDQGSPKVLDFGLARLLDADPGAMSSIADSSKIVGTLHYMSPEQARGQVDEIDIRSDVYALGVILYELLTAKRPYVVHRGALPEAMHNICEVSPRRPAEINRSLRGDLETIMLKALEKEPERRYQSAAALANDIDRFLSNQPILARSPSAVYQLQKMVSRHKLPAALAAALFIISVVFAVVFGVLAARVAEERDNARQAARRAELAGAFVERMLASPDPKNAGPNVPARDVLDKAAVAIDTELADEPDVRASMHDTIGRSYMALDVFDRAEQHLQAALTLRRSIHGERHAAVAASLHQLGRLAGRQGDREERERLLREAYDRRRGLLGEEHPDIAESLHELAELHKAKNEWQSAEKLHRQALAMRRKLLGDHRDVAESLQSLGRLLREAGRYDEAEPHLLEAAETWRRLLGNTHYLLADTLSELETIYSDRGDEKSGERICRERLRIYRDVFGRDHHTIASALSDLAVSLMLQGEYVESEALFEECLAVERRAVGEENADVVLMLNNFSGLLTLQGRYKEAEPMMREVYRIWVTESTDLHPGAALAAGNLGTCLFNLGRHQAAESFWRESVATWRELFGDQHPSLTTPLNHLGELMRLNGDLDEAERFHRDALHILREGLGEENPDTVKSTIFLAIVLHEKKDPAAYSMCEEALTGLRQKLGNKHAEVVWALSEFAKIKLGSADHEAAEALFREAIEIERQLPRERHPVLAECLTGLSEVFLVRGESASAEPLLIEALDIQEERLVESDRRTALTRSALGACLTALGRREEAEPMLLESHAIIEAAYGPRHRKTKLARQRIVALYTSWERPDLAAEWKTGPPSAMPVATQPRGPVSDAD